MTADITPDTKDWTWVLERPCPECGFDASSFARERVGQMVRENAASWRKQLERVDATRRPAPEVWSTLEYACHVRDVFRIYDHRLLLMLTEVAPRYPNWDQDATAVDQRYGEQDPDVVAEEVEQAGAAIALRFDQVGGEQWKRTGFRSDGAEFTVESFARYFIHDPIHHLHDVRDQ